VSSAQPAGRVLPLDALPAVPLHVVLVEPQIPPNTGNVARLCAATGCALHLVEPLGFAITDRELKRAGLDYWERVRLVVHRSLGEFVRATAQRRRWWISTRAGTPYTAAAFAHGDMLVFGKETAGLPAEILSEHASFALRIPMRSDGVRSLNLATAAGIVTYAALASLDFPGLQ